MSGLDLEQVRYLIIYGAPVKRAIRHVARLHHDGRWLPICNAHYTANHDIKERQVRAPEDHEVEYPVCKRCQSWYKPEMVT
jgi:hypothetical protein